MHSLIKFCFWSICNTKSGIPDLVLAWQGKPFSDAYKSVNRFRWTNQCHIWWIRREKSSCLAATWANQPVKKRIRIFRRAGILYRIRLFLCHKFILLGNTSVGVPIVSLQNSGTENWQPAYYFSRWFNFRVRSILVKNIKKSGWEPDFFLTNLTKPN